jgi:putative flippase GtrA
MADEQATMLHKVSAIVQENRQEGKRFVKFAIVGGVGAIVDFGVLNLLVLAFDWDKFYANIISVSCAIISNFWWNRRWTFPESREHDLHISFGKFATVNLIGLLINQAVFVLTDNYIYGPLFAHPIDYNIAKATAIGIVLFWNFFANRKWTYRDI